VPFLAPHLPATNLIAESVIELLYVNFVKQHSFLEKNKKQHIPISNKTHGFNKLLCRAEFENVIFSCFLGFLRVF